jgi:hypothetical protein
MAVGLLNPPRPDGLKNHMRFYPPLLESKKGRHVGLPLPIPESRLYRIPQHPQPFDLHHDLIAVLQLADPRRRARKD